MTKALENQKKGSFDKPSNVQEEVKPPNKVNGLMASYSADTQTVSLNWSAVTTDQAATYRVYRKESTESKYTMMGEVPANAYEDMQIVPNAEYEYYVTAYIAESNTETGPSATVKIKIASDLPPIDPSLPDPNNPDPNNPNPTDPNNPGTTDPTDPTNPDPTIPVDPNNPDGNGNANPDPGNGDGNDGSVPTNTGTMNPDNPNAGTTIDPNAVNPNNNGNGNGNGNGKGKEKKER
jgi:penicillin-binding protein 2A